MAKDNTDKNSPQQGSIQRLLSQDIDIVANNFNDEHAQIIAEDIKQHILYSAKLAPTFFALHNQGENGATLIKNFISKYIEDNSDFNDYESLISFLKDLPTTSELGTEILLFALSLAPTPKHLAYCVVNILLAAVSAPDCYTQLEPIITEAIKTNPSILQEELNDFFIERNNREDMQHYLVDIFGFVPITESPFLIDEDIEGLHPAVNCILKKSRSDLTDEDRNNLIINLITHLNLLISNDTIALILKTGSEYADIYMCAYGSGAYSVETESDKRNCMTFQGAKPYADGKNIDFATAIVHESTHICFILAYKNNAKPYMADDNIGAYIENLAQKIATLLIDSLKEKGLSPDSFYELASDIRTGYNEFVLVMAYKEKQYSEELPAFFMQELAIRMLSDNAEMRDSILLSNSEAIFGIINPMLAVIQDTPEDEVAIAGVFSFMDEVA